MRKLIVIIAAFLIGHYYGAVIINAAKDAYTVIAKDIKDLRK
tara:strand:+ start:507 stop:632 length:126 start_codon:yes stop_codon:yes gene_type:complete